MADASLHRRLALAWKLLFAAYLALAFVSLAILWRGFDSDGKENRSALSNRRQGLIQVGNDVFCVLDADRDTGHAVSQPDLFAAFLT